MDFLESSVRKVQHLASSYNSKWTSQKVLLYTLCMILQASLSTKLSVISESGFVWTLLESFSLANKNDFANQQFYKDYAVNQNSFIWNKFRLSLLIMSSTLSHSTHFRATCNFNTDGLVKTDYLRGKTTELNILLLKGGPCVTLEYINIRGYEGYNCSVWMTQRPRWHLHIDSQASGNYCPFKNFKKNQYSEDNFGYYHIVNPKHRCTSGDNSTTQWWFGEQ